MKKTIKYLDNDGNYQYATVKDAGDLDKLKTKAKEDLVSAINELATNGIAAGSIDEINNKVDQIQQQVNQNADALNMSDQERQEMQQQIAQMQAEVQAKVAEMQKLAEEQNRKLQEASAELKKKADAIDVQKMQQDNAEALKNSAKALEDSLAATNEDLQKTADHLNEMEIQAGVVETSVKELQNGFESKVSSADFNEARTKLQEQETMVRQLNNELSTKASNNELDMVTQRVQKAESNIQQNAQGIKASVTKETMYKEMDDFAKYRENRLKYSRDFSNDWSLNGNDIIDDDHLFDTQHDVKSVSIRNGAYLTQTTDLDTDDMSKTFTLAMWVEKGKKPRAWYGSAELTNMKVKEDKGDYQRVYWTFVPTIVKQDIRITGDTSTQGNLVISEPKLEQSDRPSAWSTNTGDQYATTEKLAHDLKLTSDKLESTITKQSEFADRQQQDESRITQTEHGVEVANQTIVAKTDGLRQEFDGKISATSKSLTSEYQSFTNQAIGQMADGGSNLILNSSFGNLKNSYDKWTNVSPKVRIVEDDNGLKWAKMEQSGLTANSPIGLTSNLFRVKKGIVTVALDIRTDNAGAIDNDNIVILESYNADQKRVFTQEVGFNAFKITKETLFDHGPHRVTYKYNQTRDDTQYMAVHIVLPKNGVLYVTNVLARTVANGEDSGEYAPNAADLHEQVVQQRTRIEQNDQAIALKADQTKVTQDIDAAKSSLSGAINKVEQRAANLEVKADGITSSVSTLSKTIDGISVGGRNLLAGTRDFKNFGYLSKVAVTNGQEKFQAVTGTNPNATDYDIVSFNKLSLEKDTDYTASFWAKTSENVDIISFLFDSGSDGHYSDGATVSHATTDYKRFVVHFHNGNNNATPNFIPVRIKKTGVTVWVYGCMLEKGTIATDWTPAPEDTDSSISSLQSRASKLEQTDSEIRASVTSVTNDLKNGRGSIKEGVLSMTDDHFETKFSSIDNKIDGISVGGTNLVKATSKSLYQKNVTDTWYWLASSGSHDNFDLTQYKGETISARAWIDKPSADAHLQIWTDNGMAAGNTIKAGQSGYSTITGWKVPTSFNDWNVPIGNGSPLTMGIKEIKIEKGNKPTDWSPAPEDTSAEIKSAKDAAIQVASDQINLHVNELSTSFDDKLNKRVNEVKTTSEKFTSDGIEQVVTKVTNVKNDVDRLGDTIDGIQIGGTNVLKNTDPDSFSTTESDHTWTVESGGNGHGTLVDLEPNFSAKHGFGVIGNTGGNKDFNQHPMHWNGGKYVFTVYIRLAPETGQTSVTALIRTWNYTKNTESYAKRIAITSKEWHKFSMEIDSSNFYKDDCGFSFGVTGIGSLNFAEPMLVTGTKAMDWSPAPEDISQQITNTNKKIDTQTLDSANIDDLKTQGHYFVRNLTGNPIGGWVYVDVTGNNNDRVRQDVYQDNGNKHMYRRLFSTAWSGWEQGAYLSDVNNVKTEVTASVKNLGDRVTTEVNSITSRVDNLKAGGRNLVADGDASAYGATPWENTTFRTHPYYYNSTKPMFVIDTSAKTELTAGCPNWFPVKAGHQYTFYFNGFMSTNVSSYDVWLLGKKADAQGSWTNTLQIVSGERLSPSENCIITKTFTVPSSWSNYVAYVRFDNNGSTDGHSAVFFFNEVSLKEGNINTGYSPAPENTVNEIKKLNTKWDVANGQIQGKVTATDVNNILNGKGYATQSWAESNFRMKSDSIELEVRKITDPISNDVNNVNSKLDNLRVGGENLIPNSGDQKDTSHWYYSGPAGSGGGIDISPHGFFYNGARGILRLWNTTASEAFVGTEYVNVEPNTEYTLSFDIFGNTEVTNYDVFVLGDGGDLNKKVHNFDSGSIIKLVDAVHQSPSQSERIVKTFRTNGKDKRVFVRFNNNGVTKTNSYQYGIWIGDVKLEKGNTATAWSPSGTELVDKTTNLQNTKVDNNHIINTINSVSQINMDSKGVAIKGEKIDIQSLKSAINLDDSGVHIKGDHISINGNTGISGTLDVKDVVLSGKKGLIQLDGNEGISLIDLGGKNGLLITPDKVQLHAFNNKGGSVDITNSGVTIGMSYNKFEVSENNVKITNTYNNNQLWLNDSQLNFTLNSNNRVEVMGGLRTSYLNTNGNINGIHLVISTQQELGDPYGGDEFGIGRQIEKGSALTNGTIEDDFVYNASGVGKLQGFHFYKSIYLEDTNKKPIIFYGDNGSNGIWMNAYGNIEGGANSWAWKVRDAAGNVRLQLPMAENKTSWDGAWMRFRDFTMDIEGAENKLKFTWWSNGGFYGGVKVPCLATDNVFSGKGNGGSGIAFANGQYVYFTRDKWRSVGI